VQFAAAGKSACGCAIRLAALALHDLKSLSIEEAIERHRGEADDVARHFRELNSREQQQLLTFLNSL
jgi:CxxC motif-containing protein (DUF1111 family)